MKFHIFWIRLLIQPIMGDIQLQRWCSRYDPIYPFGSWWHMPRFNFFCSAVSEMSNFFLLIQYGCHTMWPMMSELLINYAPWGVPPMFKVSHRLDKWLQRKTILKWKQVWRRRWLTSGIWRRRLFQKSRMRQCDNFWPSYN